MSGAGDSCRKVADDFHQQLAYLAHVNGLKGDLTALENLRYGVGVRRDVTTDELRETLQLLQIAACADLPVRALSAGQKRRVALARIMLTRAVAVDSGRAHHESRCRRHRAVRVAHRRPHARRRMILTAAHQLLLQGQPGVRTLELH